MGKNRLNKFVERSVISELKGVPNLEEANTFI